MVTAPSRPLVHSYDPARDPMELVDTPSGRMERWRADALLVGETSALASVSALIRDDAANILAKQDAREAELNARDDAISARERQVAVHATRVAELASRVSVEMDRLQKIKADAEREPIALPPDNQNKLEDALPGEHTPGGELHTIAAKDPAATESELAKTDEMPAGGSLHLKTPIHLPVDMDEADPELPKPPATHPQSIAAGLDSEE